MTTPQQLWLWGGVIGLFLLFLLRRQLGRLLRLGGRSVIALTALSVFGRVAPLSTVLPGANLLNATVLGLLGLPGLGLLLMVQWIFA